MGEKMGRSKEEYREGKNVTKSYCMRRESMFNKRRFFFFRKQRERKITDVGE